MNKEAATQKTPPIVLKSPCTWRPPYTEMAKRMVGDITLSDLFLTLLRISDQALASYIRSSTNILGFCIDEID